MPARASFCILAMLVLCIASFAAPPASVAAIGTTVSGIVMDPEGHPAAGATVRLSGRNIRAARTTDEGGHFAFASIEVGSYEVRAASPLGTAEVKVDVGSDGAFVTVHLLKVVASVQSASLTTTRGAGTNVTLNSTLLARLPSQGSLPETLLQLPGAARGANGVVHVNGDHGDYNYIVDGMPIPQELNREIGTELDPEDISFMDVLEGAYPAQYGGRFGLVVNINTRAGSGSSGTGGYVHAGSFGSVDSSIGVHRPLGAGTLVFGLRGQSSNRFLDPPNFTAVHDRGSNANAFVRYTAPHGNDYFNVTATHSHQAFQIPNDVENGEPAATDDNEAQDDTFVALQYAHSLRGGGSLSFGLGAKRSRIRDFPDQANDFVYGETLNAAGGAPGDCAGGTVSACAYSLSSDRTARDLLLNVDDYVPSHKHGVRAGVSYDAASVQKRYAVTLQPGNFLAPVFTPSTPNAAHTVTDDAPNAGQTVSAYVQDTWTMGSLWTLDYGVRYDNFRIFSSEFARDFAQVSPRVKITRNYGPRSNAYLYVGRFFEPFSFENVSPKAAQTLNLPNQPALVQFDLKPERATSIELGGHAALGRGQLGLRVMQKTAADLIDDTQVGTTALHQDINYAQGSISTQSISYQQPLQNAGRAYASVTHTRAVNKGCETQLLAPCFGAPHDWTPADHDQRFDVNGGVLRNDTHGGWLSFDAEYGSGLSSAFCDPLNSDCKVPPHTTFDVEKGIGVAGGSALTLRVRNIFNDRYRITYLNAQGNHYAAGRTFELGYTFGSR